MFDHFNRGFITVFFEFPVNQEPICCRPTVCSAFKKKLLVKMLGAPLKHTLQINNECEIWKPTKTGCQWELWHQFVFISQKIIQCKLSPLKSFLFQEKWKLKQWLRSSLKCARNLSNRLTGINISELLNQENDQESSFVYL